jgi:hypothetical protein
LAKRVIRRRNPWIRNFRWGCREPRILNCSFHFRTRGFHRSIYFTINIRLLPCRFASFNIHSCMYAAMGVSGPIKPSFRIPCALKRRVFCLGCPMGPVLLGGGAIVVIACRDCDSASASSPGQVSVSSPFRYWISKLPSQCIQLSSSLSNDSWSCLFRCLDSR